jgi:hypothetical protein
VGINSYLFQFDPLGENAAVQAQALGSVNFLGDILGLIFEPSSIVSSDSVLGSIGDYGLASDRGFSLGPEGSISVSANRRVLNLDLSVLGDQMLQFRVITRRASQGLKANEADFNADGAVDGLDLAVWQSSYNTDDLGDADNDGDTDGRDFMIWQRLYGTGTLLSAATADFNGDGFVNNTDLTIWQSAYGINNLGDADNDGDSDGRDFMMWQRQYGAGTLLSAASQVPEPSSLGLCALATLGIMGSRHRRLNP